MEIAALQKKIFSFLKKYRYVALVLLIGLVLMAIPEKTIEEDEKNSTQEQVISEVKSLDDQLEDVLSQIEGAGRVQVMITYSTGEETIYQTNDNTSLSEDTNSVRKDTVTVTDADRNQKGLIRQVNPPDYLGAIVVCQGADSPAVRLAIVDAVSKVTGLGSDCISVLKMK